MRKSILALIYLLSSFSVLFAQNPIIVQAESTSLPLGSGFNKVTQDGVQYISAIGTVSGTAPVTSNRMATYSVAFPAAGVYDLYARVRVTEVTAGTGITHDAFYYANGFGSKSATNGNDWITVNNLFNIGTTTSGEIVTGAAGTVTANVWKWIKLSEFNGGEAPIQFTVSASNLTPTFLIGARESQLDIDKLAFGVAGVPYTVFTLDGGVNVNTYAPVITPGQVFSVSELFAGPSIGAVLATDEDDATVPGSTVFQNWQITEGTGASLFAINPVTGELTVINSSLLDFEETTSYTLVLTVGDGLHTSVTETITINLVNENDNAPEIVPSPPFVVSELSGNVTIGMILASDADDINQPGYTVFQNWQITGGTGAGIFSIDPTNGTLSLINSSSLDFEVTPSYSITVTVSDGLTTSLPQTFIFDISNENDNRPVITPPTIAVSEQSGDVAIGTVFATDADDTNQPGFTIFQDWQIIGGTGASIFAINPYNGLLSVVSSTLLDFETAVSYSLMVQVSDGFYTSVPQIITVTVLNANDNTPVIAPVAALVVSEQAGNVSIGSLTATDADDTHQPGYTALNWQLTGGTGASVFSIDPATGTLSVSNSSLLDFEVLTSYSLIVAVSDGLHTSLQETITINISNENDNAPAVTVPPILAVSGEDVGVLSATDADDTNQPGYTTFQDWQVTGGTGALLFAIDPLTGGISVGNISLLTGGTYLLIVTVSDGFTTSLPAIVTLTVSTVSFQNPIIVQAESTSLPLGSGFNNLTQDGVQYISAIGTVSGTSPVTTNRIATYSVTFPAAGTYDLYAKVRVTEALVGTGLTHDAFYYANGFGSKSATDGNDWITVNNLFVVGTTFPSSVVTGAGIATTNVWKWIKLSDFNGGEVPRQFTVSPESLTQTFQIGARESQLDIDKLAFGLSGVSYTVSILENGADTNVHAPVIAAAQSFSLSELFNGPSIGTVLATDEDDVTFPGSTVFQDWQITGGTGASVFTIDSLTGALSVTDGAVLDFEITPSYSLIVTVSDGAHTSEPVSITLNLTNENDHAPEIVTSPVLSVSEQTSASIGTLAAIDADDINQPGYTIFQNWQIAGGTGASIFAIDPVTGLISVANSSLLDFETDVAHTLSVTVSDGLHTSDPKTVDITIINANDNTPVVVAAQVFSISETAPEGAVAGVVLATDADDTNLPGFTTLQDWQVSGTGASLFNINATTGIITVADNSLDFETTASYALEVTVSDGLNTSLSETVTIQLTNGNEAPTAIFTASTDHGDAPLPVSFNASESGDPDGDALTYAWNFGDGSTGSGTVVSHSYSSAGTYLAVLTVTDPGGLSATASVSITVSEEVTTSLRVQYKVDKSEINARDSHVRPNFQIVNTGDKAVRYKDLTIRYWYTREDSRCSWDHDKDGQRFSCEYAALGTNHVKGKFVAMPDEKEGADYYLEIRFTGNSSLGAGKKSGEIRTKFSNANWVDFDERDDYSYDPSKKKYTDWTHVTLYRNGQLVWGVEPTHAPAVRLSLFEVAQKQDNSIPLENNFERSEGWNVYPNPSLDGQFTIELNNNQEKAFMQVIDGSGKEVIRPQMIQKEFNNQQKRLSPGIYFIRVADSNGVAIKKLVVKN